MDAVLSAEFCAKAILFRGSVQIFVDNVDSVDMLDSVDIVVFMTDWEPEHICLTPAGSKTLSKQQNNRTPTVVWK